MIGRMHTTQIMKVSQNGQVSIPAATRTRWQADRVVVVDLGDYIVMRPASPDPVSALLGKYADRGPNTEVLRQEERAAEADRARQRG